jgi:SagB-type dehydrogenase family enzyme
VDEKPGSMDAYRFFLKDSIRKMTDFSRTDQNRGVPAPPVEKPFDRRDRRIDLVAPDGFGDIGNTTLLDAVRNRKSRRRFSSDPLSVTELSFLLWATQGVRRDGRPGFRTVPSAGARHALETYVYARLVTDLEEGIYRYLPVEHQLLFCFTEDDLPGKVAEGCLGQSFAGDAAAVFAWTTIPYRMEWRYGQAAHKVIAIDAGHVGQNLYLACEAVGAGMCAIAAYDQDRMDRLLRIDGRDEFTLYIAVVGKRPG